MKFCLIFFTTRLILLFMLLGTLDSLVEQISNERKISTKADGGNPLLKAQKYPSRCVLKKGCPETFKGEDSC